ncbi:MAG: DUF433 domain-containing protein [Planctomycetes bacterium]|nr:DUF433 domain-containing protein [Planctomycetota bacterium]MBL7040335.1 DUF433 domain-containing protein [Pirellulaceae bacterium]
MNLRVQADPPPLYDANDRVVRISGTRIPLERVVRAFLAGSTPEQIAQDYDVLSIEDVYAVVNYYLHHRPEVDAYLAEAEHDAARIRDEIEERHDPAGIRARLLARRSAKAE